MHPCVGRGCGRDGADGRVEGRRGTGRLCARDAVQRAPQRVHGLPPRRLDGKQGAFEEAPPARPLLGRAPSRGQSRHGEPLRLPAAAAGRVPHAPRRGRRGTVRPDALAADARPAPGTDDDGGRIHERREAGGRGVRRADAQRRRRAADRGERRGGTAHGDARPRLHGAVARTHPGRVACGEGEGVCDLEDDGLRTLRHEGDDYGAGRGRARARGEGGRPGRPCAAHRDARAGRAPDGGLVRGLRRRPCAQVAGGHARARAVDAAFDLRRAPRRTHCGLGGVRGGERDPRAGRAHPGTLRDGALPSAVRLDGVVHPRGHRPEPLVGADLRVRRDVRRAGPAGGRALQGGADRARLPRRHADERLHPL